MTGQPPAQNQPWWERLRRPRTAPGAIELPGEFENYEDIVDDLQDEGDALSGSDGVRR